MKVKDFIKKVNGHTQAIPVILRDANSLKEREAESFDISGYPFKEADKTVINIDLFENKIIVNYK